MSKLNFKTLRELHRQGKLDTAKNGYLQLLQKNPRDFDILHALGILYAQQDNYAEAIDYLQQALKIQPHNETLILHLANVLKFQGLYSQAANILENLLAKHPNYPPALNNLGNVYYAQGNLEDAAQFFKAAIRYAPHYIDAYYNLGLALNKQNKLAEAENIYTELLKLSPEHFAARFHLACILMQQNKIDQASVIFKEIIATHPNHFETHMNLAHCYLKKGFISEAKQHYMEALEIMPNDIQSLYNLGVLNMQQGNIDVAIQYYQRAARITPDDFAIQNNLGVAFIAKQHLGFAIQHFQEALRIQPNNVAVQHTLQFLSDQRHLLASPPDYIKTLFDAYADHYEPHLLTALDYQVPNLLLTAIQQTGELALNKLQILDLGCGTGLCGAVFKPYAKQLIGVDLSPKMLAVAAQKNIYDELVEKDLVDFLQHINKLFDLVIAGDVFVYMGELDDIFQSLEKTLPPNGLLVFNTEITEDADYKMNQSGRFAHRLKYIEKLAEKYHFKKIYYQTAITRLQNNDPVYGHILVLRRE